MKSNRWFSRQNRLLSHLRIAIAGTLFVLAGVMLSIALSTARVQAQNAQNRVPTTHLTFNGVVGPLTEGGDGTIAGQTTRNASGLICSTSTSSAANVNTDCEGPNPHNETTIAINPTNPFNRIGSANDYQLSVSPGGTIYETLYSRAHVTFDGGQTWATYAVPFSSYTSTGDPAVAFDADGRAYLATLGFLWSQNIGCCINPDVLVAHSEDGGKTWSTPSRIAAGTGSFGSVGLFNDKEYVAAWGHGNAIVTWTEFNDGIGGSYISSPIFASVTHDGGKTWSTPTEISGSAAFCIGAQGGTKCDQDQASVPVVAADGSIYVTFLNFAEPTTTGRDQYLVVKVDPATGQRVAGPYKVGLVYDGFTDYPINIDGRQTYQDSQFRTWAAGNMTADPTNAAHLAVVWSDMRNSTLPAPSNPYAAVTNSDIIVSQSFDGGQTWSAPTPLTASRDQFMPWGSYDSGGILRIGYFDRSYDAANHKYGYTLATETSYGSLTFATAKVTTKLSDPTKNDRWFSGRTPNLSFPHPTTFLGDYSGIAPIPGGGVANYWTDMRINVCFTTRCGAGEDAFYATAP
jgi:hypothetical protein